RCDDEVRSAQLPDLFDVHADRVGLGRLHVDALSADNVVVVARPLFYEGRALVGKAARPQPVFERTLAEFAVELAPLGLAADVHVVEFAAALVEVPPGLDRLEHRVVLLDAGHAGMPPDEDSSAAHARRLQCLFTRTLRFVVVVRRIRPCGSRTSTTLSNCGTYTRW